MQVAIIQQNHRHIFIRAINLLCSNLQNKVVSSHI